MQIDRSFRLAVSAQTAERLQLLVSDPAIVKFFEDSEKALVDTIIGCLPSEVDERLDAAMKASALRSLRRFLEGEVGRGTSAAAKLENMRN